ncbi:MAG TPA: hypothetical protein VNT79_15630 [Phycisphaerae bacterium]|nr:hypothetical protein [Phycisphaerae bacterium]
MADNSANSNGILGVVIGAIIVLLVGGGILYATGVIDPQPTNVTIQQPAATPAPSEKDADRSRWDGRDNDRRGDRWDGRRDDDRGDRGDGRGRDNDDRRGDRSERR